MANILLVLAFCLVWGKYASRSYLESGGYERIVKGLMKAVVFAFEAVRAFLTSAALYKKL